LIARQKRKWQGIGERGIVHEGDLGPPWRKHLRRVLVPEERDETDSDFETPFLMHISPVATVTQPYQALTDLQRIP